MNLFHQHSQINQRISAIHPRSIQQIHQSLGSLQMSQKIKSPPSPLRCSPNQPRHIRQHHTKSIPVFHRSYPWMNRCKWIWSNLGHGLAHGCQQRRLSRIGISHQTHIGDELQFQFQMYHFSLFSLCLFMCSCNEFRYVLSFGEGAVAYSSPSPLGHNDKGSWLIEICNSFFLVFFHGIHFFRGGYELVVVHIRMCCGIVNNRLLLLQIRMILFVFFKDFVIQIK
mmetsp:Transcript_7242/g.13760  ORF Transcript_7242/g.13760 Transcript_7242/m.13760 type:complete len:225 (+) Transcript_7242:346-1020(+)